MLKSEFKQRNRVATISQKSHPRNFNLSLKSNRKRLRNRPPIKRSMKLFFATSAPLLQSISPHSTLSLKTPVQTTQDHTSQLYDIIETDPFLGPIHNELSQVAPSFPVSSSKIKAIDTPDDFYQQLLSNISTAKHRICLSALYLGSDAKEIKLVENIDLAMKINPDLHVLTLFDKHRGQRLDKVGNSSYNLFLGLSKKYPGRICSSLYTPPCLLSTEVPLDHTSDESFITQLGTKFRHFLRSQVKGRAKELFSVHHMKAYITDDIVIMSGANLSDIYFTNRQDRYLQIQNRDLSDYASAVVQTLSFGNVENTQHGFYNFSDPQNPSSSAIQETTPTFIDSAKNPWFEILPHQTMNINDEKKQIQTLHQLLDPKMTNFFAHRRTQRLQALNSTSTATETQNTFAPEHDNDGQADLIIYPSIQLASFGIHHDEKAMVNVLHRLSLDSLPPHPNQSATSQTSQQASSFFIGLNINMLTGYFNVSKVFIDAIAEIAHNYTTYTKAFFDYSKFMETEVLPALKEQQQPSISPTQRMLLPRLNTYSVAACREANGWWKAGGLPGHIPDIYKSIIDGFNDRAEFLWNTDLERLGKFKGSIPSKLKNIVNIHALEYKRGGWSYHAKGLFVQPNEYFPLSPDTTKIAAIIQQENVPGQPINLLSSTKPLWTTVGSSNYGYRSLHLDSELQFSLLIPSQLQRDVLLKQDTTNQDVPDIIASMNDDLGNSLYFSQKEDQIFVHPVAYALRPIVKHFL